MDLTALSDDGDDDEVVEVTPSKRVAGALVASGNARSPGASARKASQQPRTRLMVRGERLQVF
jgi:hypothetical protein